MDNFLGKSCINCVWSNQCRREVPCDFYDNGRYDEMLTDEEIEVQIEINRKEYRNAFQEYIKGD